MSVSRVRWIVGVVFAVAAIAALGIFRHAAYSMMIVVTLVYLSFLMVAFAILLDYPRLPRQARVHEAADELQRMNLLISSCFTADRAFRVDELHREGPHYFLELHDGSVLHLSGPYLFDYEPGAAPVRHFPCTRFTVRRHAETGDVLDIVCEGLVIEPEVEAPPYTPRDFSQHLVPRDGEILRNVTFDQLRQQRAGVKYRVH